MCPRPGTEAVRVLIVALAVTAFSERAALSQSAEASPPTNLAAAAIFSDLFAPAMQPQAPPPPPPVHGTGFKGLIKETGRDFVAFPRRPSTWVILGVCGAAAALSHLGDDYVQEHIVGSPAVGRFFAAGKWIGSAWVQVGASVGVYLIGRYVVPHPGNGRSNKVTHVGFDLIRAQIVSQGFVQAIKYSVRRDRPTGECCAFPSGHAATAFAAASVLERHFGGYRGAWPTMVVASYVAASRLHDNKHFLSDVVFGSAIGMATGWTIVGRHGRSEFVLQPMAVHDGFMIALSRVHRAAGAE